MRNYAARRVDLPSPGRKRDSGLFAVAPVVPFSSAERYESLRARWQNESRFLSFLEDILACPSGLAVERMGDEAVPHLVAELEADAEGSRAVVAMLAKILKRGPEVAAADRGKPATTRVLWLEWLREQGLR